MRLELFQYCRLKFIMTLKDKISLDKLLLREKVEDTESED